MRYEKPTDDYDNVDAVYERGNNKKTGTAFKFITPMTTNNGSSVLNIR